MRSAVSLGPAFLFTLSEKRPGEKISSGSSCHRHPGGMAAFPKFSSQSFLVIALTVSVCYNLFVAWRLRALVSRELDVKGGSFSYENDDYPVALPLRFDHVALNYSMPSDGDYDIASMQAYGHWRSLDMFPHSNGFVRLGPKGRKFGLSMFHQIHCLNVIRMALVKGYPEGHTGHCMQIIRQAVLCASDVTLDPLNSAHGTDGIGVTHVCRDWTQVYDFVVANQEYWAEEVGSNDTMSTLTSMID